MKKTVKIISIILLVTMLLATIASSVYAADPGSTLDKINGESNVDDQQLVDIGNKIVNIIQVVGIVIAVVILLVIGIKYMVGSASDKAEFKKSMIPYLVGAILIFAGTSLVKVIYSVLK